MEDQTPSIQNLAKTISADIAQKLNLPSGESVNKLLLKEIQALSDSNKALAKSIQSAGNVQTFPKQEAPIKVASVEPVKQPKENAKLPDIIPTPLKEVFSKFVEPPITGEKKEPISKENPTPEVKPKSQLENAEKPKPVIIDGFSAQGSELFIKKLPEILKSTFEANAAAGNNPKSELEKLKESQPVLLDGFTDRGVENFTKKLPDILKKSFDFLKDSSGEKGSKLPKLPDGAVGRGALGALAILGGIATLLYGLMTDGPFKGLAKLVGKSMLEIGDMLLKPIKKFVQEIYSIFKPQITKITEELLEKANKFIRPITDRISRILTPITEGITSIVEKIIEKSKKIISPVTNFFKKTGEKITEGVGRLLSPITESLTSLKNNIVEGMVEFFKPIKNAFLSLKDKLFTKLNRLIAPIVNFGSNLINTITSSISNFLTPIKDTIKKAGEKIIEKGSKLLSPLSGIAEWIGNKLFDIPKRLFKAFRGSLGGIFGSAATAATETAGKKGIGKLLSFVPKFLGGVLKTLSKAPIIGSLISIGFVVSRFLNGDVVGGGIELLSVLTGLFLPGTGISLAFDALNAVLDYKAGGSSKKQNRKKLDILGKWIGELGSWMKEKLKKLPILGDLITSFETIAADPIEFLKGLDATFPVLGLGNIVDFFESKVQPMQEDNKGSMNFLQAWTVAVGDWAKEKLKKLPFMGALIDGIQSIAKDPAGAIKYFSKIFPAFKWILGFFESEETPPEDSSTLQIKNPFAALNEMFLKKVKDWWKNTAKWLRETLSYIIPDSTLKVLNDGIAPIELDKKETKPAAPAPEAAAPISSSKSTTPSVPTGMTAYGGIRDAMIDPNGGLLLSSPKVGALWQLDKRDGVVAAPMTDSASKSSTQTNTFAKAEMILERIAGNTAVSNQNISNLITGFNNLAKALEKTLGESAKIPVVINNTTNTNQGPMKPTASQYANAGNSDITNFRMNTVEGARFNPA